MANRINYFLPYMRQGLAAQVQKKDINKLGKRISLRVTLNIETRDKKDTLEKDVFLYGPGDVLGINSRVISKVTPAAYTNSFEPLFTPFIEFSEPDLLWRFSTAQTKNGKDWIPWLSLIILKVGNTEDSGEFKREASQNSNLPPVIKLTKSAILPDLAESWRWAHVHLLDSDLSKQKNASDLSQDERDLIQKQIENAIKQSLKKP